jgi:2-amino-4-hydroxy-6-hydroxymethyldihydropteridine diphosphokinase
LSRNGDTRTRTTYIGLGSNVGDRLTFLRNAAIEIAQCPEVTFVASSAVYQTEPVGPPQPDFYNAVIEIETSFEPHQLLAKCQEIERQVGRITRGRWQQREVDLDILLLGDERLSGPELTVPHPLMEDRAFVLVPLSDLVPHMILPSGKPLLQRLEELGREGVTHAHPCETLWPPP